MGKLFNQFSPQTYINEAQVIQNYTIPLLTNFLGYHSTEIIPEKNYPSVFIRVGHRKVDVKTIPEFHRPDTVVCINDIKHPKFVVESKDPNESLDDHLDQLQSYANGVKVNFLVITNGVSLRIYDANELIFEATNLEQLDIRFSELKKLLSRDSQYKNTPIELIQGVNLKLTLNKTPEEYEDEQKAKIKLSISDFVKYLENICKNFKDWQLPPEAKLLQILGIKQYPPEKLHMFRRYDKELDYKKELDAGTLENVEDTFSNKLKIFIAPTGMGKTSLLRSIAFNKSKMCIDLKNDEIPVYIQLRHYSSSKSINSLISDFLQQNGYDDRSTEILPLLQKRKFVFLFDGFDEVQEELVDQATKELETFSQNNPNQIIITTRPERLLTLSAGISFEIIPLDSSRVEEFAEMYLGIDRYKFIYDLEVKQLTDEAKNTFLLTLLLILYRDNKSLPLIKSEIIRSVIEKIKDWEKQKGRKSSINLNWQIKEELLGELSFHIIKNKANLTLAEKEVTEILIPKINSLEKDRKLKAGIDIYSILNDLCSTGIVIYDRQQLSFIHRIFINYFASESFAQKFESVMMNIKDFIDKPEWTDIIIGSSAFLSNATLLIEALLENNLSLAEMAYVQGKNISNDITEKILKILEKQITSKIHEQRQLALMILAQMKPELTSSLFFKIFQESGYTDVKKVVLEQIGKQKTNKAKEFVLEQIDWDQGGPFVGSSQGSVAKALANFGLEEQLKIIDIWRKKPDIFTTEDCYQALLSILNTRTMNENLQKAILDFFLEDTDIHKHHKESYLRTLLQRINNEDFVEKLIQEFDKERKDNTMFQHYIADILASYESKSISDLLIKNALDEEVSINIRIGCTQSLVKRNDIDDSIYQKLLGEKDTWLKHHSLAGLKKSKLKDVKDIAFHFYDCGTPLLQGDALNLLESKGMIINLLELKDFHKNITYSNFGKLLSFIRKHKITKFIPVLDWWNKYIIDNDRLRAEIAHTYYVLNEKNKAEAIINIFVNGHRYTHEYVLVDILEMLPDFEFDYAYSVLEKIIKIAETLKDHSHYVHDQYIECVERISDRRTLPMLKGLANKFAKEKDVTMIERTCRAINRIATNEDEDWYIEFIQTFPGLQRIDLRRAIEGLGIVGSFKSLPLIIKTIKDHPELKDDDNFIDTAYLSIKTIYINQGINKEIDQTELFE